MAATWTYSLRARDEARRLVETDCGRDDGLGYGVSSGDGALKSELGHILQEESQDLLVRCEMSEKDETWIAFFVFGLSNSRAHYK